MGRRGGAYADVHPVDLLSAVLRDLIDRTGLDAALVDDHIAGCVSQIGDQSLNVARNAWLAAGLPEGVPSTTVDRQCGSSQQAIHFAAQGVMAGTYDLIIASGLEHMTRVPLGCSTAGENRLTGTRASGWSPTGIGCGPWSRRFDPRPSRRCSPAGSDGPSRPGTPRRSPTAQPR